MSNLDKAEDQSWRLSVMVNLTREILAVTDSEPLLQKIVETAAQAFRAQGCVLRLKEDGVLRMKAMYGFHGGGENAVQETILMGDGICGWAAEHAQTLLYDFQNNALGITPTTKNVDTAICVPLMLGGSVRGTFSLFNRVSDEGQILPFSSSDSESIEGFASVAAIIIERSLSYERMVRQEREATAARQQIEELKDYLQGLIFNSADAIVTTDLDGRVISWNSGAERIFGYSEREVVGGPLPIIPHFLEDIERGYAEQIQRGETVRDIETVRITKQGVMIDASLTLSPIKNAAGSVIGISRIARDITEKKRTEKKLLRTNNQLQRLFFISSAMRGTLKLDRILRMVLAAVTVSDGLGFNRAVLFLVDEEQGVIRGAMGVGPASHEEAWEIWSRLSLEHKTLSEILNEIHEGPLRKDSFMDRLCCGVEIPLDAETILAASVQQKKAFNVHDVRFEPLSDAVLIQQLGTTAYAVVPLISRDKVIGVLWVDNLYSQKPISDEDLEFLRGFTDQTASAIENARLFEHVARAEQELENIFESISDLVYFVDRDYVIRKVNRAVVEKIGLPEASIVGQKCFWIFHGMNMPWESCPHRKTIQTSGPHMGELEDPHLGGVFLISSSPIFDQTRSLVGTVHIARDISELKQLREKVVSVERMAALGEMAAKVAHEIRNPLLSIGGFAGRLEKRLNREQREQARIIVEEVKRLETILSGILGFVRTARLEKKDFLINDLMSDVVTFMEPVLHERRNRLLLDLNDQISVFANYDRIREALLNLVANANQAAEDGTITLRAYRSSGMPPAEQRTTEERQEVVIEVEDSGSGIRKEDMHRIFDPFFTTRTMGTGLGLSIAKRIIDEHKGTIDVHSSPGTGANFVIHLPIKEV
ncbi:MAG TPA: PAS domain S-box protein [Dissulfurispiraceae bacterium]|nr:PAS domain S-box protein [Dissulfurispiraceae bacterium]